jgi:hypothetical protein
MTQDTGACAECTPVKNGITVKGDPDFGAIEIALVVNGHRIAWFMTGEEAHELSEKLKGAICQMMGDETRGGRCSEEELDEINKRYREDAEKNKQSGEEKTGQA